MTDKLRKAMELLDALSHERAVEDCTDDVAARDNLAHFQLREDASICRIQAHVRSELAKRETAAVSRRDGTVDTVSEETFIDTDYNRASGRTVVSIGVTALARGAIDGAVKASDCLLADWVVAVLDAGAELQPLASWVRSGEDLGITSWVRSGGALKDLCITSVPVVLDDMRIVSYTRTAQSVGLTMQAWAGLMLSHAAGHSKLGNHLSRVVDSP